MRRTMIMIYTLNKEPRWFKAEKQITIRVDMNPYLRDCVDKKRKPVFLCPDRFNINTLQLLSVSIDTPSFSTERDRFRFTSI